MTRSSRDHRRECAATARIGIAVQGRRGLRERRRVETATGSQHGIGRPGTRSRREIETAAHMPLGLGKCRPAGAGIGRHEHADPRRGIQRVGVVRALDQIVDALEVRHVGRRQLVPRCATVCGQKDAGAALGIDVEHAFTGTGPDAIPVGSIDDDLGDREIRHQVADRRPGIAAIGGLEDTARHAADVHRVRRHRVERDRTGTSADIARSLFCPRHCRRCTAGRKDFTRSTISDRHSIGVAARIDVALVRQAALALRQALLQREFFGQVGLVVALVLLAFLPQLLVHCCTGDSGFRRHASD
ncbi:MAG: hypothetical protein IPO95_11295 [Rhodanobacteraceae bacterium]|nr:hypothetical protein [Rhodanobacteraceae bacterium]